MENENKEEKNLNKKPNKKLVGVGLIIVITVVAIYFLMNRNQNPPTNNSATSSSANSATPEDSDSWKEYSSVESGFKVNFPTSPKRETRSFEVKDFDKMTGESELYTSSKGNTVYFVEEVHYSEEIYILDPQGGLEGAFNAGVSEIPNHKVIFSKLGKFLEHDSLDYLVQNDDYYMHGKTISVGERVYSIEMDCKIDECSMTDYQTFIDSFQLQ